MIQEFIEKCNFDSSSVLIQIGDSQLKIENVKYFTLDDVCVSIADGFDGTDLGWVKVLNPTNTKYIKSIDKIDLIIFSISAYNTYNLLKQNILNKTLYVYLEYSSGENRTKFELPGSGWHVRFDTGTGVLFENFELLEKTILSTGAWNSKNLNEHSFDEPLAFFIMNYLKDHNVKACADFGCGDGSYTEYLNGSGIITEGYDGNPYTPELTDKKCKVQDLSISFDLEKKFDCVMSLEVGEHIPKFYEEKFIGNLVFHTKRFIILSWAVPGQGGHGHVNCQENSYIKALLKEYGFENRKNAEDVMRRFSKSSWFKDTVMVFERI